jgi:hypothetical protein
MIMNSITITLYGVRLNIEYTFEPHEAPSGDSAGDPESYEIDRITTQHGDEVLPIFTDAMIDQVIAEIQASQTADQLDYLYEQWRDRQQDKYYLGYPTRSGD